MGLLGLGMLLKRRKAKSERTPNQSEARRETAGLLLSYGGSPARAPRGERAERARRAGLRRRSGRLRRSAPHGAGGRRGAASGAEPRKAPRRKEEGNLDPREGPCRSARGSRGAWLAAPPRSPGHSRKRAGAGRPRAAPASLRCDSSRPRGLAGAGAARAVRDRPFPPRLAAPRDATALRAAGGRRPDRRRSPPPSVALMGLLGLDMLLKRRRA